MKQLGKERISFGQSTHTYLRISWNLRDEIFPKGVGAVTLQKFCFYFQQKPCLVWKSPFKSFLKSLSLKNFFPWQGLWFLHPLQPWYLVIKNLSSEFPFSKSFFGFYFLLKRNPKDFEATLLFWTILGFTMPHLVKPPKTPPSSLEQSKHSVPTS